MPLIFHHALRKTLYNFIIILYDGKLLILFLICPDITTSFSWYSGNGIILVMW